MRRSQAPSLKSKVNLNFEKNKNVNGERKITNYNPNYPEARSTESVLSLLSSLQDPSNEETNKSGPFSNVLSDINDINKDLVCDNLRKNVCQPVENSNGFLKNENPSHLKVFSVVYGKQTKKKHRTWEGDGTLEVGSKQLILKDDTGKVIGSMPCSKARKVEEGVRILIGSKEVELIDVVNEAVSEKNMKISKLPPTDTLPNSGKYVLCKKYKCPRPSFSTGMIMPEPNSEHQWHFNKNGAPLTPVYVEESLSKKMRNHQCDGVKFLYECVMGLRNITLTGAILADEMGLGKTLQCISLIWTLLKQGPYGNKPVVKKVLVVTPSSLTTNWFNEFIKWLGRVKLVPFVVSQKNKPSDMRGPVMIISYEMLVRYLEDLEDLNFDLLICDEGHRLKNSNIKTTQSLLRLNCSKKIILTGTPIQNDLQEFYTLVDFVNPNVLGTPSEFRRQFEEPILASRQPETNEEVLRKGKECALNLKKITSTFLLRRTRDILKNYLPPRHDIVIFCEVSVTQKKLYNTLIDSFFGFKENDLGLIDGVAHLELISSLKKICNHPLLYSKKNAEEMPLIEDSGKILVTINILKELQQTSKEKVVLVSNSTQTLNLIEKILKTISVSTCRLDGTTPAAQRNNIVERFNNSYTSSFVFLLSAKAGGVGLNITGASRLILFDSDWNPATDLQAVSRIWRDGQKYPVYIYRLLTTGTIEEKIYQRQMSKQGLCEGTVDPELSKSIKLSKEELKDLFFYCEYVEDCLTHNSLFCECSKQGDIPIPEVEEEERSCQLVKQPNSALKISELLHWEHHGRPYNKEFLMQLCLKGVGKIISFIFHNCQN